MKNVRRFLSLILVSVMVLAMSMTAFAKGETDGKITITTSEADLTFEAYQVIAGDVVETTQNGVTTTTFSNVEWGKGIDSAKFVTEVQKIDGFSAVKDAETFVEEIAKYGDDADVMQKVANAVAVSRSTEKTTSTGVAGAYELAVGEYGYYFVTDTDGLAVLDNRTSKYYLVVVDGPDATNLKVKTEVPEQEKKVQENTDISNVQILEKYGTGYDDVADYFIGDEVPFELISHIPNFNGMDSYYYEFVDKMDPGFTFVENSVEVIITNKDDINDVKITLVKDTHYTLDFSKLASGNQFSVVFNNLVGTIDPQYIGEKIVIRFKATLNTNAVVGDGGNLNESYLRYGNNPSEGGEPRETPPDQVIVFTYELPGNKVDESGQPLDGAEFVLKNSEGKFYFWNEQTKKTEWVDSEDDATVMISDANGDFGAKGLDQGTYYLKEIKAPAGYNLLKDEIEVKITATGAGVNGQIYNNDGTLKPIKIDVTQDGASVTTVTVENQSGVELPETGGIGTTIFYIVGALLALGAGVVLVTRRRVQK